MPGCRNSWPSITTIVVGFSLCRRNRWLVRLMSAILVSLILAQLILLYSRRHSSATGSSIASYRFLLDVDGEFVGKNSSTSLSMTSLTSIFSWRDDDGTDVTCFRPGVENQQDGGLLGTQLRGSGRCRCRKGWYGRGCSVPEVVWRGGRLHPFPVDRLTLRHRPRRVVNAMPFNIEFDLLDIRLAELGDVVDVFLILESNFTQYGDHKPFKLRDKLRTSGCGGYDVIDDHRE
jgi:Glycosyltransferase family 17